MRVIFLKYGGDLKFSYLESFKGFKMETKRV